MNELSSARFRLKAGVDEMVDRITLALLGENLSTLQTLTVFTVLTVTDRTTSANDELLLELWLDMVTFKTNSDLKLDEYILVKQYTELDHR